MKIILDRWNYRLDIVEKIKELKDRNCRIEEKDLKFFWLGFQKGNIQILEERKYLKRFF